MFCINSAAIPAITKRVVSSVMPEMAVSANSAPFIVADSIPASILIVFKLKGGYYNIDKTYDKSRITIQSRVYFKSG